MFLAISLCSCGDNDTNTGEVKAIQEENKTKDPLLTETFNKLKTLVEYSRKPEDTNPYVANYLHNFATRNYLVGETIKFNECTLVSEKVWRPTNSAFDIDLSTPASKQAIMRFAWKINLGEVDAEKTDALRSSKIILVQSATNRPAYFLCH